MPPERHPRRVFEKLFGSGDLAEDKKRRNYQKSILDFVLEDTKSLKNKVNYTDGGKLEAYLTAVREVELRIEQAEQHATKLPNNDLEVFGGVPQSYREHVRTMYDLMTLAFQTDTTRVASFLLAHDGSNRAFPEIGVRDGHHTISHHRKKTEMLANIAKIDTFYAEQFAYFLQKLKTTTDGYETNLLENSMIVYGGGIADGNRHNHDDLPFILAGNGAGLKAGQYIRADKGTPMTNVHLALLSKMGVQAQSIGDSTEVFDKI